MPAANAGVCPLTAERPSNVQSVCSGDALRLQLSVKTLILLCDVLHLFDCLKEGWWEGRGGGGFTPVSSSLLSVNDFILQIGLK